MGAGVRVFHHVFGVGHIVGIGEDSFIVKFDSLPTCRNILFGYWR